MKTIKIGAPYFMCIDEESQKLYSIGHRTSVIDMNSATVQTQIKGFRYAGNMLFIHKYGLLFLETNNDECWLLNINDYSIVKRFKYHVIDGNVCYDDIEEKIYVMGSSSSLWGNSLAVIDVKNREITNYNYGCNIDDNHRRFYSLHRCSGGEIYLFESCFEPADNSHKTSYTIYGRYNLEDGKLNLIEKIFQSNELLSHIAGKGNYLHVPGKRIYRVNENDIINYVNMLGKAYWNMYESEKFIYFWDLFDVEIIRVTKDFKTVETVYTCGAGERIACYAESEKYKFLALDKYEELDKKRRPIPNKVKSRILVFDKDEEIKNQ